MGNPKSSLVAGRKANGFVNRRSGVRFPPPAPGTQQDCECDQKRRSDRSTAYVRAEALEAAYRVTGDLVRGADGATRFWAKVNRLGPVVRQELGPCWLWMAAKTSRGYGAVHWNGRLRLAHRVSLELAYGEAPRAELQSCHRCDTPLCVRPSHLFLGTGADNAADMTAKGRSRIGERNGKAKLDADDVTAIRRRFAEGESKAEVARVYGVTRENIHAIVTGQTWRHIREAS